MPKIPTAAMAKPSGPTNAPASPTLAASVIIIDDSIVITGSFNFTKAAETRNAENVVVIDSPAVATWFTRNWEEPRSTSRRFETE